MLREIWIIIICLSFWIW